MFDSDQAIAWIYIDIDQPLILLGKTLVLLKCALFENIST